MAFMAGLPVLLGASPFYLSPGSKIAKSFPTQTRADMVKVRLSAMGFETGGISRDAIYSLFIASRIINFLKGIPSTEGIFSLNDVLCLAKNQGGRPEIGADLLRRLLAERLLYASTRQGFEPLGRFNWKVFSKTWSRLKTIGALNGAEIHVG